MNVFDPTTMKMWHLFRALFLITAALTPSFFLFTPFTLSQILLISFSLPLLCRFLLKAGFLKSHHCYEIVFTVPDVPTVGKELSCPPSSSPSRKQQSVRVHRINSTLEGKFRHDSRNTSSLNVLTILNGKWDGDCWNDEANLLRLFIRWTHFHNWMTLIL